MKLHVTDTAWGISRKDGSAGEKVVGNHVFDAKVGPLPEISHVKFEIKAVKENSIVLFLSEKTGCIELEKGKSYTHRPMSFDGGHYYTFTLE